MTAKEIRQSFLQYFADRGHAIVPSSSLVPADDPTLLFTNAGMNQFKDVFLGKDARAYRRATTSQKCMRVSGKHNDLDTVGPSLRHHTFFEMLGNFSFGDYFKKDALPFAWELLTGVWKLDKDRLFPSIFKGERGIPRDDESFEIWKSLVPASRITELGLADNFWSMGETGPCGRCSEIYFFRGHEIPCSEPVCRGLECSCDRYIEIWNNVFMEFDRQGDGALKPLPALSVDTGMGLERITSVIQGKLATYDTDLFAPILRAISARAGRPYTAAPGPLDHPDVSMRVIADHLRAMTFLIADGVLPSNEWRGYVLRKIMRRAMRHGKKLGFTEPVLHTFIDAVVGEMGEAYPALVSGRDAITRTVRAEEERFDTVLTSGLPRLDELVDRTLASGAAVLPADEVFKLYDSLGMPLDFITDIAGQRGAAVDTDAFDQLMEGQRERARAGGKFATETRTLVTHKGDDRFIGYDRTSEEDVAAVSTHIEEDGRLLVWLDRTPFYAESGGQVSDTGTLTSAKGFAGDIVEVRKAQPGFMRAHVVRVGAGTLAPGDRVTASVNDGARGATRRNHTATHLLHAALRERLGSHVHQKGSLVAPDRLRFDFSHDAGLSPDERRDIESAVNEQIVRNSAVTTEDKRTEDAMKAGAMALFGEKYGDRVRVVSIPGYSMELCGGTHVRATGDIGPFVLIEESGVAAGVRRIEALTGTVALTHIQAQSAALQRTLAALGASADHAPEAVAKLQAEIKKLSRENDQLKMKIALGAGSGPGAGEASDEIAIGDAKLIVRRVTGLEKSALRGLADSLRDRIKRGVVVLAAEDDGKVHILASVTKDLLDRVKAGALVKELAPIVGGAGGGRPDFAEAGGKDASQIDALLSAARDRVTAALS